MVDSRRGPKSNNFVEKVGFYNPITKEQSLDADRVKYWLGVGARPSDTVYNMLVDAKVIDGDKKNVLPQKTPIVKEVEEVAADAPKEQATEAAAPETTEATTEAPVEETASAIETEEAEETKEEVPADGEAEATQKEE